MSWMISRALMDAYENSRFSQALVAEYSEATCSAGEPSAQSSGSPTQLAYLPPDKMTEFSRLSRFGMTFKPLTDAHGEDLLTSYLAAFRVRTSAPPAAEKESKASAAECGNTWPESSVKYDPVTSSWKTARCLWDEDLPWSSVTLPTWGMTRNGFVFRHPTAERPISVTAAGLWPKPNSCKASEDLNLQCSGDGRAKPNKLGWAVAQRTWPTATATASKGWSKNHNRANSDDRLDYTVEREYFQPGQQTPPMRLNPTWVEWLMAWPQEWTDLKPLAMDKFREWQRQHSPCCQAEEDQK